MTFQTKQNNRSKKPLCVRFDEIDGFIRACGEEFRHLV